MARTRPVTQHPLDVDHLTDEVLSVGRAAGLDAVGVCDAAPFTDARRALEERKAAGLHAGMGFTYRNPARSTTPGANLPDARALVVGAVSYHRADDGTAEATDSVGPQARVARYAREDHYATLHAALGEVSRRLRADGWRTRISVDDNTVVDRAAAHRAGLGWFGKNANLLLPGRGSWFVLGALITDAPLRASDGPVDDGCGTCRRCLDGCPTTAIVAPGVVDARRCLSWLLQAPGSFPVEFRAALGDRIYGCDDCQEVCPPNRRLDDEGLASDPPGSAVTAVLDLLSASDDELLARHGRWYLHERQPRWLRRNALVVLANIGDGADPAVAAALQRALADPEPVVRAHAVWAAGRLGRPELVVPVADDPDPGVRAELALLDQERAP